MNTKSRKREKCGSDGNMNRGKTRELNAKEIMSIFLDGLDSPEDIFRLHDELQKLSEKERELFRYMDGSDAFGMSYITAAAMKEEGTWDSYVEECKNKKRKTAEEIKTELMEKYL